MSLIIVSQIQVKIWETSGIKIGRIKFLPVSRFFINVPYCPIVFKGDIAS